MEWEHTGTVVYNMREDIDCIVNSWEFEYEIFELVCLYKTFDEENYYLVYRGG
ncbi:MAG: hypothetical protein ACOCQD_04275 [archaeon]